MLRLQRYPRGTVLYVRAEKIIAVSEFGAGNTLACVVHIENDAREAVWGTAADVALTLRYTSAGQAGEACGQVGYDKRIQMLQATVKLQPEQEPDDASAAETK